MTTPGEYVPRSEWSPLELSTPITGQLSIDDLRKQIQTEDDAELETQWAAAAVEPRQIGSIALVDTIPE